MTTKADVIRNLYKEDLFTVREIAAIVKCSDSYVRVCARQRRNGKLGPADRNYKTRCMAGKSRDYAREKARAAYRAARDAGLPINKAMAAYGHAWSFAMGMRTTPLPHWLTDSQ